MVQYQNETTKNQKITKSFLVKPSLVHTFADENDYFETMLIVSNNILSLKYVLK